MILKDNNNNNDNSKNTLMTNMVHVEKVSQTHC